MAGTYIEGSSQVLSGVYTLIKATVSSVSGGTRGVVTYPCTADWGPVNELYLVAGGKDYKTTYNAENNKALTANKIYKHAYKGNPQIVLAYRMATNAAATGKVTLNDTQSGVALKLETKYPSGRQFTVTVKDAVTGGKTIELLEDSVLLMSVSAETVDDLYNKINSSDYLIATEKGANLPDNIVGVQLTGGNNGSDVTATEYTAYLDAVEADGTPNSIALDGVTDEAILTTFKEWVTRVRYEGLYITGVRGGTKAWDSDLTAAHAISTAINYRGFINVGNGCDGYSSADLAIFIAARAASVALNAALTDEVVPYTVVNKKVKRGDRIVAKTKGTLIFVMDGSSVVIDEAVNTLTNPSGDETAEMGKIRVNNAVDAIAKDLEAFGEAYKKNKSNTEEARQAYATAVMETYFKPLARQEVVQPGYLYEPDPDYYGENAAGKPKIDEAFFAGEYTPVDSMEKVYQKLGVKF